MKKKQICTLFAKKNTIEPAFYIDEIKLELDEIEEILIIGESSTASFIRNSVVDSLDN